MRRLALLLVAAAVLVGCDWQHQPHAPSTRASGRLARVQVTVVDGDTNRRVPHARVTIGKHSAVSDRHGVARVPLPRRAALVTVAAKRGYTARAVRLPYRTHPQSTIRIFRPALQWSMYGVDPQRSQAQAAIRLRPPFRVVWSRGIGGLIEFPAVVADGVAYVGNARETIRALDMRDGTVVWRRDTPGGKMASSPAVWRDTDRKSTRLNSSHT